MQIVENYYKWSQDYNEGYAVIIYDTMYDSTRAMAEAIAEGLGKQGVPYKLFNVAATDQSDLMTDIFKAKGVLVGSCTVNNTVMRHTAGLLEEIKAHRYKGKLGAGFGSYGWSGEASKVISASLENSGLSVLLEPLRVKYRLSEDDHRKCVEFGESFAKSIKG